MRQLLRDLRKSAKANREIEVLRAQGEAKPLSGLRIESFKRSDTLFVLGSGASVAGLSPGALDLIRAGDSVGFNFWLVHDLVPTLFLVETSKVEARNEAFFSLLKSREHDYLSVPLIVQYKLLKRSGTRLEEFPTALRDNIYLHAPWALVSSNATIIRHVLRAWNRWSQRQSWAAMHLIHHRASLALAVMLGVAYGYRKLVLVGVDLNDTRYFWDIPGSPWGGASIPPNVQTGRVHATADAALTPTLNSLPVTQFLTMVREELLDPRGVEIYSANPRSLLCDYGIAHLDLNTLAG